MGGRGGGGRLFQIWIPTTRSMIFIVCKFLIFCPKLSEFQIVQKGIHFGENSHSEPISSNNRGTKWGGRWYRHRHRHLYFGAVKVQHGWIILLFKHTLLINLVTSSSMDPKHQELSIFNEESVRRVFLPWSAVHLISEEKWNYHGKAKVGGGWRIICCSWSMIAM